MRARERRRGTRPHPEFVPIDHFFPAEGTAAAVDRNGPTVRCDGGEREPGAARDAKSGALAVSASASPALSRPSRLWVNVVDGMVLPNAPPPRSEVRGGMLCDEPGLGKTITVLALLLRTRGLLPGEGGKRGSVDGTLVS